MKERKKEIKVNYQESGVKTLNGFGKFFMIVGSISALVAVIGVIIYLSNLGYYGNKEYALIGIALASSFFPISIGAFACGAICKGLSTIAKTALYKRALLEEEYSFVEELQINYHTTETKVSEINGKSKISFSDWKKANPNKSVNDYYAEIIKCEE